MESVFQHSRPLVVVVLAMSLDGKIADGTRSAARFGSTNDKTHLETQIAKADAVLFGANTLRAYGTTLRITQPHLLQQRLENAQPPQPVHIVCSQSGNLDPQLRFFQQPVPRWLLTSKDAAARCSDRLQFDRVLIAEPFGRGLNLTSALQTLANLGIQRLAVLGGGELVASLLVANLVDELYLTICPLILGGRDAPTPVEGTGFSVCQSPRWQLIETRSLNHEVFLHYRIWSGKEGGSEESGSGE